MVSGLCDQKNEAALPSSFDRGHVPHNRYTKGGMFQQHSAPISPSSSLFSSLSLSHGLDFAPVFDHLSHGAYAGGGQLSPTPRGLSHQPQYLAHSHSHSGSPSCATATTALHPQQHFLPIQRLPHCPSTSRFISTGHTLRSHMRRLRARMEHQTPHDVAAQQEAAKDYQPALQGPLVGEKTPSHIITQEYAKADQVYIEKTTALPETYSHYRPIQGDGNCGWRAIGFSYFEKLVEGGDQSQIEGEVARLKSLNHLLSTVGGYDYFEDFAEEAFDLLREVAAIIDKPQAAHDLVRQRWNDVGVEGSLIFYFRLLAATFLKANAATYEPFIPGGQSVAGYCGQNIEVVNREIEQLGIIALVNILLKPLNFVLEIAYLDRSPGSQVNRYRFPDEANGKDVMELGPIIHLLYRPDHYDILYQSHTGHPPAPTSPSHLNLQVNRVAGFTQNAAFTDSAAALNAFSTVDFGALSMIPGISNNAGNSLAGMISMSATPSSTTSATVDSYSSSQQDSWMSPFPSEMQSAKAGSPRQPQLLPNLHPSSQSAPLTSTGPMGARHSLIAAGTSLGSQQLSPLVTTAGTVGYPIRFSPHQWEYENKSFSEPIFQVTTNTFKNSIWNRAHYGNPDFQPEEWNPDEDGPDTRQVGKRKVRKDSR